MSEKKQSDKADGRKARLAKALRANLKRRKAQARDRGSDGDNRAPETGQNKGKS